MPAPALPAPPVKRVVLYKHGVGYFERRGPVDGAVTLELSFKADEMPDLLKSLFALDLGGGRIADILYDAKDPLAKQLEGVMIDVPADNALTQLVIRLKGARVEAAVGGRTLQGNVLGLEPVNQQAFNAIVTSFKLILAGPEGIQPLNLWDVTSLKLLDDPLNRDLQRILEAHLRSKYADRKTVRLRAEGTGTREVRIGYIVPTPIWKTSYRMIFEEGRPPHLQGWAIAENATDDDWTDVQISFVAGAPMSFRMDLYTSYYPPRQTIGLPALGASGFSAAALEGAEEGITAAFGAAEDVRGGKVRALHKTISASGGGTGFARRAAAAPPAAAMAALAESSSPAATRGVEVGDLFAYESTGAVSIPRGKAALVPILGEGVQGSRRVLYYKPELSPLVTHACLLHNATGLTLESGPVTFFDGETCVGEGVLRKALRPGMRDLVPFALETACTVTPDVRNPSEPVFRATLSDGVLHLTHAEVHEVTYRIANRTRRDYELYLDYPRASGYARVEPAAVEEELPAHYRFRIPLAAGAAPAFTIRERKEITNHVNVLGAGAGEILLHLQQGYLSEGQKRLLQEVADLRAQAARAQREIEQAEADRARLKADLEDLRKNVGVLRDSADELALRQELLQKLRAATARNETLQSAADEARARKQDIEDRLARRVREYRE